MQRSFVHSTFLCTAAAGILIIAFGVQCIGQPANPVAALTADETAALQSIRSGSVLATVAFLASDEMAGRDTPSRELDIACSYVAARFQGAGLEPLAADQSYFQTEQLTTISTADAGAVMVKQDGTSIPVRAVIPGLTPLEKASGHVYVEHELRGRNAAEAISADERNKHPSFVVIEAPDVPPAALNRPEQFLRFCVRQTRPLVSAGAAAVLMKCPADSDWPELVDRLRRQELISKPELCSDGCILLVDEDQPLQAGPVTLTASALSQQDRPVRNVVGILRGSDAELSKSAVVVTAHLDHIGRLEFGPDRINNGADDNATGVTAVLALAEAFAQLKQRPRRSIIFMTFWGEEKGLMGSRAFVKAPLWPLQDIYANINIEMIGRPEADAHEKIWMTGWKHSRLGSVMDAGARRVGVEVFNRQDVGEMLYSRSDNYSFVERGIVAHSFSAGSLHSDYHQPTDEWDRLNISHMTKVIQGLFAGILHLADSDTDLKQQR